MSPLLISLILTFSCCLEPPQNEVPENGAYIYEVAFGLEHYPAISLKRAHYANIKAVNGLLAMMRRTFISTRSAGAQEDRWSYVSRIKPSSSVNQKAPPKAGHFTRRYSNYFLRCERFKFCCRCISSKRAWNLLCFLGCDFFSSIFAKIASSFKLLRIAHCILKVTIFDRK